MAVSHLAPEDMRNTWLTDWEKLAGNETSWRKFMRKVEKWQEEEEKKKRYSVVHAGHVLNRELRMTRRARVDALELDFVEGKAKCPLSNGTHSAALGSTLCKMQSDERGAENEEDGEN